MQEKNKFIFNQVNMQEETTLSSIMNMDKSIFNPTFSHIKC